jgi:hypothetical protein
MSIDIIINNENKKSKIYFKFITAIIYEYGIWYADG